VAQLRVLIVDDEPIARLGLREMLRADPTIAVVGECATGRDAVRFLRENTVDVVLLDVQMPGLDGFDVLAAVPTGDGPVVIFTTAFDSYAIRAFDAAAIDYVLKPIEERRLQMAMDRARRRLEESKLSRASERFLATVAGDTVPVSTPRPEPDAVVGQRAQSRIRLRSGGRVWYVDPHDVEWIEADDYYASLQMRGRSHLLRKTLTELESELDPSSFVRIHRSVIVNLAHVREIRTDSSGRHMVAMRGGRRLPLSRSRKEHLHRMLRRIPAEARRADARRPDHT
jgi:two-component system, LytTR family, response regulator